jgi:hypothetical protein
MKGILYQNDGGSIEIINNNDNYHMPKDLNKSGDNVLFIRIHESFGYSYDEFYNTDKLINVIKEYDTKYGITDTLFIIFNEVIVNPKGIDDFTKLINKKCYYANYDMNDNGDPNKIFLPLSLYSQLDYLIDEDYLNAKRFLINMTRNYRELIKPYKLVFLSNHISPIRIDIFNILKYTDNLKNSVWSFNTRIQYYSGKKHNLNSFFKDNEGIIPYSYDAFNDKKHILKSTYFSQFLSYFEVVTESYFFNDIKNFEDSCPITEKIVKPVASFLPFIFFGSPNTRNRLMEIGMTFNCPLYGFYDTTKEESINEGIGQFTKQILMTKEELHSLYYKHEVELYNNATRFFNHFIKLKKTISEDILFKKNEILVDESKNII